MRTNLDRALNGRDMAASALKNDGEGADMALEDYEIGLVDALANLLHFARRYEIDFDDALRIARSHHQAEQFYAWDTVPE
jgi:hypothetical protein